MPTTAFKGSPLTVIGRAVQVGMQAPSFTVIDQELQPVTLDDLGGSVKVISSFPSLDTPVCDLQVKEFNKRAAQLSEDVAVVGISKDLPFAQKRFCQEHEITRERVLSDYRTTSFGINYGLLIKELNLLARAVMIVDTANSIRYIQVAPELTKPLDYEDALRHLGDILRSPVLAPATMLPSRCVPCTVGTPPLAAGEVARRMPAVPGWSVRDGTQLVKEWKFKHFADGSSFAWLISVIAETQGHHPVVTLSYTKVAVTLTTHASNGLTENDFIMARDINALTI